MIKKSLLQVAIILLIGINSGYGQIIGSNCFLKGNYVEVGVNQCGAYGSNESPPGDYHETTPFTGLGFVADPGEDGWDVGDPVFCGDYFVPGSPVEGWQVQIGATTYTNTDQSCGGAEIPGSITDYYYAAGEYVSVWEGDIAGINLHITQKTIVPENEVYFLTEVTFCNDGATDVNNLYYKRNVDPDQDVALAGDYWTDNVIEVNPPDTCTALVTATGTTIGCFLGMGALDTMARASFGLFGTDEGTAENAWNGTGGYSNGEGETVTCDCATQITFKVPVIPAGECRTVTFAYILNIDDLTNALEATLPVDVLVDGEPAPADDTLYICNYEEIEIEISGGESYEWTWTYEGGTGDITTSEISHFTPDGNGSISMEGLGGFCGVLSRKLIIIYEGDITADAGEDLEVCIGSSVELDGSGGETYMWSPITGLSDPVDPNADASPTTTTTYTLTAFTQHGCSDTDEMVVTVNPLPNIDAGADTELCPEGSVQLQAEGGIEYTWEPSTGLSCDDCPDPICTVDDNTTYTVTGVDANGCINTDEVDVSVFSSLVITATASPNDTIDGFEGESTQLNVTGAVEYEWEPSTGLSDTHIANPIAQPEFTTTYYVTGTDENGCIGVDSITIYVVGEIALPTAFSPNEDGINDVWAPIYSGSGEIEVYSIYNRWGQEVYTGNGSTPGWDGTWNGKEQEMGTYTVLIRGVSSTNVPRVITGNFILVR
ncbi:MAG: gliding motility-associated C-terminal domain-containing protein [Chitinophagales bacterium]|nr:gliding motility-associated C-terminal domain-containing protein [Bacteroidota bacterium]MBP8915405.1 gliding motility-associated C-terminal domain-containing protein [Chitinophagales bacterium]MBP9220328.1 gliding motility-associated C-terminal domain-containing protein [Chitinophagales bacterium]MBP9794610.1 gliding motility-associated C-terminal domain-containing protein [Chitinophagales bacterium]